MSLAVRNALELALKAEGVADCFTMRSDSAGPATQGDFSSGDFHYVVHCQAYDGGRFFVNLAGSGDRVDTVTLLLDSGVPVWWIEDAMSIALESFPSPEPLTTALTNLFRKLAKKYGKIDPSNDRGKRRKVQAVAESVKNSRAQVPLPQPKTQVSKFSKTRYSPKFFRSSSATNALMQQLRILSVMDTRKDGFTVHPNEEDLYEWRVNLFFDEPDVPLAKDLVKLGEPHVTIEMRFPGEYPYEPPFCRIVSPAIRCGSGHITEHGGICMELLTPAGWTPANSIDVVCIQIRALLISGRARLNLRSPWKKELYTQAGAERDFAGLVRVHGWGGEQEFGPILGLRKMRS